MKSGNWRTAGILPSTNIDVKITGNQPGIQFAREFEGYVLRLEDSNKVIL
jgi:hypothetical protein